MKNRKRYLDEGRSLEGNALQKALRAEGFSKKVNELRKEGLSFEQATEQALLWINTQAVLDNPDQIAGGNPLGVEGMGDAGVNSSIGAQWKYRVSAIDEYIIVCYKAYRNKK